MERNVKGTRNEEQKFQERKAEEQWKKRNGKKRKT